jgi:hypothetical protein
MARTLDQSGFRDVRGAANQPDAVARPACRRGSARQRRHVSGRHVDGAPRTPRPDIAGGAVGLEVGRVKPCLCAIAMACCTLATVTGPVEGMVPSILQAHEQGLGHAGEDSDPARGGHRRWRKPASKGSRTTPPWTTRTLAHSCATSSATLDGERDVADHHGPASDVMRMDQRRRCAGGG